MSDCPSRDISKRNHAKLHIFFQKCQKLQYGLCKNERLGLIFTLIFKQQFWNLNPFHARYGRSGILPFYSGYRSGRTITLKIAIPSGGARCRRTLALITSSSRILEVTIVISNMAEVDREG